MKIYKLFCLGLCLQVASGLYASFADIAVYDLANYAKELLVRIGASYSNKGLKVGTVGSNPLTASDVAFRLLHFSKDDPTKGIEEAKTDLFHINKYMQSEDFPKSPVSFEGHAVKSVAGAIERFIQVNEALTTATLFQNISYAAMQTKMGQLYLAIMQVVPSSAQGAVQAIFKENGVTGKSVMALKQVVQSAPVKKAINTFTTYVGSPVAKMWNSVISGAKSGYGVVAGLVGGAAAMGKKYLPSWGDIKGSPSQVVAQLKKVDRTTVMAGTAIAGALLAVGAASVYGYSKYKQYRKTREQKSQMPSEEMEEEAFATTPMVQQQTPEEYQLSAEEIKGLAPHQRGEYERILKGRKAEQEMWRRGQETFQAGQ